MKKLILLVTLMISFHGNAQVFPIINVRTYLSPYSLNVEVWNSSLFNVNCQGFITTLNMQNNRYIQFYFNQFIWSGSVGRQNYYLGPYTNGMRMIVLNHSIQCFRARR